MQTTLRSPTQQIAMLETKFRHFFFLQSSFMNLWNFQSRMGVRVLFHTADTKSVICRLNVYTFFSFHFSYLCIKDSLTFLPQKSAVRYQKTHCCEYCTITIMVIQLYKIQPFPLQLWRFHIERRCLNSALWHVIDMRKRRTIKPTCCYHQWILTRITMRCIIKNVGDLPFSRKNGLVESCSE